MWVLGRFYGFCLFGFFYFYFYMYITSDKETDTQRRKSQGIEREKVNKISMTGKMRREQRAMQINKPA